MSSAVIGLGFGDEGKGCTVDWLCSQSFEQPLVIRYSGGHQAGHNVIANDVQHVFSNFGSGSIRGARTFWSKHCTVDPVGLKREYETLQSKGITPKLILDSECPITTPFDKHANQNCITTTDDGSCGVGFFETLKREKALFSITINDLSLMSVLKIKVDNASKNYYRNMVGHELRDFLEACQWLVDCPDIVFSDGGKLILETYNAIFESSQGLLLDQDIGFMPHCTPSNVGSKRLDEMGVHIQAKYYVTRAYQTRHGNGPMTNHGDIKIENPNELNFDDGVQGVFRKSMLDLDLLEYALMKDGGKNGVSVLVVTCLEHVEEYKYHYRGNIYTSPSPEEFVNEIAKVLKFHRAVMCTNHVFKKVRDIR